MTPLLQVLQGQGEMTKHDASDQVIKKVGLSDEQLADKYETTGKSRARDRIDWAGSYLKNAAAVTRPRRGFIALGPNAEKLLALGRPVQLSDLKEIPEYQQHQLKALQASISSSENEPPTDLTPEELIETGFSQLRKQLISDLLDRVKSIAPEAFEELVLDVLAKMGYGGGDRKSMQGVPRGPDGGIDGRINEDKLGLDQIYIQAKRYKNSSVGRPLIQSFVGAMTGGGCKKGVFVTSSSFTSEAKIFAADLRGQRLVLIDGRTFTSLMIEHGVGVQVKDSYHVAKVDQDFFSEDD